MLDPITLYAGKVATSSLLGGVATTFGLLQAATDGIDATAVVTTASGIGLLAAGAWKLLSDHTAVERERQSLNARISAAEAERDAAEAKADAARLALQSMREHVLRLGLDPDALTGFRDSQEESP